MEVNEGRTTIVMAGMEWKRQWYLILFHSFCSSDYNEPVLRFNVTPMQATVVNVLSIRLLSLFWISFLIIGYCTFRISDKDWFSQARSSFTSSIDCDHTDQVLGSLSDSIHSEDPGLPGSLCGAGPVFGACYSFVNMVSQDVSTSVGGRRIPFHVDGRLSGINDSWERWPRWHYVKNTSTMTYCIWSLLDNGTWIIMNQCCIIL